LAAGGAAAQDGLLEKRESIYNNIFVFGDKDSVTMTFGHNKRYYTESSMKLSDPRADGRIHRYMTLGIAYPLRSSAFWKSASARPHGLYLKTSLRTPRS